MLLKNLGQARLNADYAASQVEFRHLGEQLLALDKNSSGKVIAASQALAQLTTDADWKQMSVATRVEAQSRLFCYIEGFYNRRRRHSSIGCQSPEKYER